MAQVVSFPGLGLSFNIDRVAFWIGDFPVYWYGITFALAFLLGIAYALPRTKKVGVHSDEALDVILWSVLGGIVGARAYYVIFQWDALYKDNPMKIFDLRSGGIAIYGGVIGAILVAYIVCRIKKLPLSALLDVGLPALLLGQAIGRWGNFFNIEAFGCNTTLPWGMTSPAIERYLSRPSVIAELERLGEVVDPTMPVHPTFFYEFVWNLAGFLILAFILTPRRKFDGEVALGYMGWYGIGRMFIEGLRTDSLVANTPFGVIRVSQVLGGVLFVVAVVWIIVARKKVTKPMYVDTAESANRMAAVEERLNKKNKKNKKKSEASVNAEKAEAEENKNIETVNAEIAYEGEIDDDEIVDRRIAESSEVGKKNIYKGELEDGSTIDHRVTDRYNK